MYAIMGIVLLTFAVLIFLSRKEEVCAKGLFSAIQKISVYLYRQSRATGLYLFAARQVKKDLKRLNPYENEEQLCRRYYADKLTKCQMIFSASVLIGGMAEKWSDTEGVFLCVSGMAVAVLIYFMSDKDLHAEVEKKQYKMKCAYPDIVHKLALYMGAGMTTRGAFFKITEEFQGVRQAIKKLSPAYEELQYTCRELASGMSEAMVYERLGKRTGVQEYIRLGTLLAQNLRRGNGAILERLREEVGKSSVERIHRGRRAGEEAVTKMLLPMVMMLLVVMLMIMIPAFSTVGV